MVEEDEDIFLSQTDEETQREAAIEAAVIRCAPLCLTLKCTNTHKHANQEVLPIAAKCLVPPTSRPSWPRLPRQQAWVMVASEQRKGKKKRRRRRRRRKRFQKIGKGTEVTAQSKRESGRTKRTSQQKEGNKKSNKKKERSKATDHSPVVSIRRKW